jgi:hypothetical protein
MKCTDCGKFMKKEIVQHGYIQVSAGEKYNVQYFLMCKCGKHLIFAPGRGDGFWE